MPKIPPEIPAEDHPERGENTGRFATAIREDMEISNESLIKRIKFWLMIAVALLSAGAAVSWGAAAYFGRFALAHEQEHLADIQGQHAQHIAVLLAVVPMIQTQLVEIARATGSRVVISAAPLPAVPPIPPLLP